MKIFKKMFTIFLDKKVELVFKEYIKNLNT